MFMIDIDNKPSKPKKMSDNDYEVLCQEYLKEKHRTFNDIIDHCDKINIVPNFIYTSFNHKPEHHKMRLVFILDKEIIDYDSAKKIQLYLMAQIGEVDEQCKNLNRIYYAGKDIIFDSGNILNSNKLIELSKNIKVSNIKASEEKGYNKLNELNNLPNILYPPSPKSSNTKGFGKDTYYNIKAIRERNSKYLKQKLKHNPIEFENAAEFWQYVYHNIDMAELLELKYPKSIRCIFHDDTSPSASVFQNPDGVWLYKCHSGSCGLIMNLKQLIEKLGNFKSEYQAIKFIKHIYKLSIKETNWSIEQKANLDSIIHSLNIGKFAELCPQANKNLWYVKDLFRAMVSIAKDNVYGENYTNSDGDVVFFVSLSELARVMKVSANRLNKISQRISVLVYHDLIRKLDDHKIPEVMLKKSQAISIDKGTDKRVNFYSIPSWVFEQLRNIEIQGNKWKENSYTLKGTSYEMFYRAEGLEVAQKIYPQHKKVKSKLIDFDTGEVIEIIKDKTTTKASDERVNKIVNAMICLITDKGYTTEKEIIYYLSKEYRWEMTELQIKRIRGQLEKLGFKRIRANKQIKDQYGIASDGYPFIIIKAS